MALSTRLRATAAVSTGTHQHQATLRGGALGLHGDIRRRPGRDNHARTLCASAVKSHHHLARSGRGSTCASLIRRRARSQRWLVPVLLRHITRRNFHSVRGPASCRDTATTGHPRWISVAPLRGGQPDSRSEDRAGYFAWAISAGEASKAHDESPAATPRRRI